MSAGVLPSTALKPHAMGPEAEQAGAGSTTPRRGGRFLRTSGLQLPMVSAFIARHFTYTPPAEPAEEEVSAASTQSRLDRTASVSSPALQVGRGLRSLDLRSLPRDDGPPTELAARRDKLAFFAHQCSEVAPGLFVSGEAVARDRGILMRAGITHVVNCIGMLCPACFPEDFQYLTLYLNDATGEDMVSLFHEVFAFIEDALAGGGRVLVHCSQGVSRSATFAIAYLMYKRGHTYERTFQAVKAARGVTNPNIGFTCQLLQWAKRRASPAAASPRSFAVAPHTASERYPLRLVARALPEPPVRRQLDPARVLLLRTATATYIWQGSRSLPEHLQAAHRAAEGWQRFEGAPTATVVAEGREPSAFLAAFGGGEAAATPSQTRPAVPQVRMPAGWRAGSGGAEVGPDSGRSCKTPRSEPQAGPQSQRSPNQRQRKVRRSDSTSEGPATARSRSSESLDDGQEPAVGSPKAGSASPVRTPRLGAPSPRVSCSPLAAASPRHQRLHLR